MNGQREITTEERQERMAIWRATLTWANSYRMPKVFRLRSSLDPTRTLVFYGTRKRPGRNLVPRHT